MRSEVFMAKMWTVVFQVMMSCSLAGGYKGFEEHITSISFYTEDGGNMTL
jgi:hypothetical protein